MSSLALPVIRLVRAFHDTSVLNFKKVKTKIIEKALRVVNASISLVQKRIRIRICSDGVPPAELEP
jgi:hypothetical protein